MHRWLSVPTLPTYWLTPATGHPTSRKQHEERSSFVFKYSNPTAHFHRRQPRDNLQLLSTSGKDVGALQHCLLRRWWFSFPRHIILLHLHEGVADGERAQNARRYELPCHPFSARRYSKREQGRRFAERNCHGAPPRYHHFDHMRSQGGKQVESGGTMFCNVSYYTESKNIR